ncbi:uncharacterized protein LOC115445916 [Manduca sexta]|uniref:uncharacterized protein LOC115445916 n=1 Tax=Manduca sexta TaxID=7130 RepID=UPI00189065D6|nr:uncharacterized protein LOC115445916 [Manduca sexta]
MSPHPYFLAAVHVTHYVTRVTGAAALSLTKLAPTFHSTIIRPSHCTFHSVFSAPSDGYPAKMLIRLLLISVVLCAMIDFSQCDRGRCKTCRFIPYKRIKRGKYPGPPKRYYSRPPVSFPYIGAFSYTPPPNYMAEDDEPRPGPPSPYKVSKRPSNDGLGDDEINNLMKHLTKQDLDKIIEFAQEKQREERPYPNSLDNFSNQYNKYPKKREEIDIYKANNDDFKAFEQFEKEVSFPQREETTFKYKDNIPPAEKEKKYTFNGPYIDQKPYDNYATEEPENYVVKSRVVYQSDGTKQFENQQTTFNKQEYFGANQNGDSNDKEYLPKPSNLRDHYDGSYTDNVPNVVKPEASAYKVENFGDLPLMNYNSKLDTVSSYHVPHYTITTPTKYRGTVSTDSSSSVKAPPLEPAPPISAAKEQSDAHLKAVKIWSHKSKGTAYTLHNDGTLSLELPSRPKGSYDSY